MDNMFAKLSDISPYIRMAKIMNNIGLSGQWLDLDYVLTYIHQGTAKFNFDNEIYSLKEGNVILIPPYVRHVIISGPQETLIQYAIHFDLYNDENRIKYKHLELPSKDTLPEREKALFNAYPVYEVSISERFQLEKLFMNIFSELKNKRPGYQLSMKGYLLTYLTILMRSQTEPRNIKKKSQDSLSWIHIKNSIDYIENHYADSTLNNQKISEAVHISQNHLEQIFSKQFSITLHSYLTQIRIQKAIHLIETSSYSFTQIADMVGFNNIHVFSRVFKKKTGVSPSIYSLAKSRDAFELPDAASKDMI